MALYSWFNRKPSNLILTDKLSALAINTEVKISNRYQTVWPTTSVKNLVANPSSTAQLTKLNVPKQKRLPLILLLIKKVAS